MDWSKVPPIAPTPQAGWFTIRASGPGYYSLLDLVRGEPRPQAPPTLFGSTGSNQTPSFDHDFRYLDKPDNTSETWSDFYKRVHIGDDFLFSTGGEMRYRFNNDTNSSLLGKNDIFDLTRLRVYTDLWYRDQVRGFVEMIDARTSPQAVPPSSTDATATTLLNGFVESNSVPWITLRAQYHILQLAASKDAPYTSTGVAIRQDPTGAAGNDVGNEFDLLVNIHLSPHQAVLLGYSELFACYFIRATGPSNLPQSFYAQYTFRW